MSIFEIYELLVPQTYIFKWKQKHIERSQKTIAFEN